MTKKKKQEPQLATRNPEDFLNDLKFIRKNKEKKINHNNSDGVDMQDHHRTDQINMDDHSSDNLAA
jgi:hypothetical protein